MKLRNYIHILTGVICIGLLPSARAVVPPPDGGYPGFNTAEGQNALFSLTTGQGNTAIGWFSLFSNTEGSFNTATGAGALLFNTVSSNNTAFGAAALAFNTTGQDNTAVGATSLLNNTIGNNNTAIGFGALDTNTTGGGNTAIGGRALDSNTIGGVNTAIGYRALESNTVGFNNTAIGYLALVDNIDGDYNTANGVEALPNNTTGDFNTANGRGALFNVTTGNDNTAMGYNAGTGQTTGSRNVYIGPGTVGVAGESDACYIGSIFGRPSTNGIQVLISSSNKLGTATSSKRFKEDIKPMERASEAIHALKPVTFRYKQEIDPAGISQFGLVAEEVEKINPDLIVRDKEGKPYSVRYDHVNAMLLNEFLKEHRKVQQLEATVAEHKKAMQVVMRRLEEQAADIQKINSKIALNKVEPRTVAGN